MMGFLLLAVATLTLIQDETPDLVVTNTANEMIEVWVKASSAQGWTAHRSLAPGATEIVHLKSDDTFDIAVRRTLADGVLSDSITRDLGLRELAVESQDPFLRVPSILGSGEPGEFSQQVRRGGRWFKRPPAWASRCVWNFIAQRGTIYFSVPQDSSGWGAGPNIQHKAPRRPKLPPAPNSPPPKR